MRLLEGRADAPPLTRRVLLSLTCVLALGLAGARIDGWLGDLLWFAMPVVAASGVLALGWVEPQSARRRRRQLIMEVPQALELMAACLGAGYRRVRHALQSCEHSTVLSVTILVRFGVARTGCT